MKTALGGGSQHREKAVNDSGGGGINNAALPLSLHPSVPRSLSLSPSFLTRTPSDALPLFVYSSVVVPPSRRSSHLAARPQASGLSSRGSSYQRASAASLSLSFTAGRAAPRERCGRPPGRKWWRARRSSSRTLVHTRACRSVPPLRTPPPLSQHLWPPAPRPLGSFSASPQPWAEATSAAGSDDLI